MKFDYCILIFLLTMFIELLIMYTEFRMQFTSAQNYSLQISEINHSSIPGNHFVQGMVSMKYLGL
jgi:hypothetical protein